MVKVTFYIIIINVCGVCGSINDNFSISLIKQYVVNEDQMQQVIYHSSAATRWKSEVVHISVCVQSVQSSCFILEVIHSEAIIFN